MRPAFALPFLLLLAAVALPARAQDIEPRAYSNAPIGVKFAIIGAVATRGDLSGDALPITDAHLETSTLVVAYAQGAGPGRTLRQVRRDRAVHADPGLGAVPGRPVERDISGFGRPAFRLSINLHGAPALSLREFRGWKQDLIVGASVQVAPPWGQYDGTRLVNVSSHRWSVKPEIGVSKAVGTWTWEAQASVAFFSDNDSFYGGHVRAQDPLYALQATPSTPSPRANGSRSTPRGSPAGAPPSTID
jgi:hypothetical protein